MPPTDPDSSPSDESEHKEHKPDHHTPGHGPLHEPLKDSTEHSDSPSEPPAEGSEHKSDTPHEIVHETSTPMPDLIPSSKDDDPGSQLSAHKALDLTVPKETAPKHDDLPTKPVPPPPADPFKDTSSSSPLSSPQVFGPSSSVTQDVTQPSVSGPTVTGGPTPVTPTPPAVTTSEPFAAIQPAAKKKKSLLKKLIIPIIIVLLIGGAAYAYFGWYMSPSVVWSQSLSNTGQGYNKLVDYIDGLSTTHYKGVKETGTFNLKAGSTNASGSLSAQSDGTASTASLKVDLGVTNLDLEERSVTASGNTEPDIYVQLSGIKELDTNYLNGELGPVTDSLDGQWIEIDHNLIADIKDSLVKQESGSSTPQLTASDIESFLKSAGTVNQKYLFSTNKATAVTKVIKNYGTVTVNGHKTQHYLVGFNAANTKAYVTAMCNALQSSSLGSYLKQELGTNVASSSICTGLETSASQINSSDTLNVWDDVSTRLIYQVGDSAKSNPAENFVNVGLDYKGGSSYPFFIEAEDSDGTGADTFGMTATLNSKTNAVSMSIAETTPASDGSSAVNLSGGFTFQPSNTTISVTAPSGAVPVATVLDEFGLSPYLSLLENGGTGVNVSPQDLLGTGTSLLQGL